MQRPGFAQTITEKPKRWISDEPMNGLDKQGAAEIRKLLLQMRSEEVGMLVASHNPLDIKALWDTVYEMDGGLLTRCDRLAESFLL